MRCKMAATRRLAHALGSMGQRALDDLARRRDGAAAARSSRARPSCCRQPRRSGPTHPPTPRWRFTVSGCCCATDRTIEARDVPRPRDRRRRDCRCRASTCSRPLDCKPHEASTSSSPTRRASRSAISIRTGTSCRSGRRRRSTCSTATSSTSSTRRCPSICCAAWRRAPRCRRAARQALTLSVFTRSLLVEQWRRRARHGARGGARRAVAGHRACAARHPR